jgi:hypothetical protein
MKFKVGDRVVRNPATWKANEFDVWGRGRGVGVVIEPPFQLGDSAVDVRWICGRCFEEVDGLLPAPAQEGEDDGDGGEGGDSDEDDGVTPHRDWSAVSP